MRCSLTMARDDGRSENLLERGRGQSNCDNYVPQWWVELDDELSYLFTNRLMKFKRIGITEILGRIWPFSANKRKSSESFSKQQTQLIDKFTSSLRHMIVTNVSWVMEFLTCCVLKSKVLGQNSTIVKWNCYFLWIDITPGPQKVPQKWQNLRKYV